MTREISEVVFIKVQKNQKYADILYELLARRAKASSISHIIMPTLEEHTKFVLNHPYRYWYLVKSRSEYVGAVYILRNNSVGISIIDNCDEYISAAVKFVLEKHRPLKEIKSVRSSEFDFNVASSNYKYIDVLEKMGARRVQVTYVFDKF